MIEPNTDSNERHSNARTTTTTLSSCAHLLALTDWLNVDQDNQGLTLLFTINEPFTNDNDQKIQENRLTQLGKQRDPEEQTLTESPRRRHIWKYNSNTNIQNWH